MSSDQNLNHQPSGLAPEPMQPDGIRARSVEQGGAGVVDYATMFAFNFGFSASEVQMAAGEQVRLPPQGVVESGSGVVTGAGSEDFVNWGALIGDGIRPAPLVGGNTPVRSPQHQRSCV